MTDAPPTRGTRDTINHALARAVAESGDRVFLDFSGTTYTFAETDRLATALAHSLHKLGVGKGECVVAFLENSVDMIVAWLAINKLDAIWVPINTGFRGEFLRHPLNDSRARVVICEADFVGRVQLVANGLPEVKLILTRGRVDASCEGLIPVAALDDHRGDDITPIPVTTDPKDLCSLIYTSGTTGPSKGCMISHNYMCHCARRGSEMMGQTRDDVTWTSLPLFHISASSGGVIGSLIHQSRIAITPRFSVSGFWDEIERSGATLVKLMSAMIPLIAHAPDGEAMQRCHGQIRAVSGAPFSADTRAIYESRFGVDYIVAQQYAMTEGYLVTSVPYGEVGPPGSAGRPNDYFDVRIVDEEERDVPVGSPGEVLFRPRFPNIMFEGYWGRPQATCEAWRNLWMHTGDIGKFDEQGYFYFLDRKKDYIRRRGENISSWEMETAILRHEQVREVAFHSVLSPLGEDDVKITVVLENESVLSEEELWTWSVSHIPYFAVPRYIEFRSELPRNGTGKILKYQLREEGCTAATWDQEQAGLHATREGTVTRLARA